MIALNAVKSELFGEGGGGEVHAAQMLDGLQRPARRATRLLRVERPARAPGSGDARSRSPATSPTRRCPPSRTGQRGARQRLVPGGAGARDRGKAARRRRAGDAPPGEQRPDGRRQALEARATRCWSAGPQIGYFYPGLTLEMDLHGPGLDAARRHLRAVPRLHPDRAARGLRLDADLGRADIVDIYVETLCDGSDTKYLYKGRCRVDDPFDAGSIGGQPVTFNRTVHGPVVGYATVDGRRVAVSRKRSSYLLDGVDLLLFQQLTRGRIRNARDFIRPPRSRRRHSTRSTPKPTQSALVTTGRLPIGARASTRGCPPTAVAATSGAASWRPAAHPHGILRAACSTTGTTGPRAASPPRTTSGHTGRSGASICSTPTPRSVAGTRWPR